MSDTSLNNALRSQLTARSYAKHGVKSRQFLIMLEKFGLCLHNATAQIKSTMNFPHTNLNLQSTPENADEEKSFN